METHQFLVESDACSCWTRFWDLSSWKEDQHYAKIQPIAYKLCSGRHETFLLFVHVMLLRVKLHDMQLSQALSRRQLVLPSVFKHIQGIVDYSFGRNLFL